MAAPSTRGRTPRGVVAASNGHSNAGFSPKPTHTQTPAIDTRTRGGQKRKPPPTYEPQGARCTSPNSEHQLPRESDRESTPGRAWPRSSPTAQDLVASPPLAGRLAAHRIHPRIWESPSARGEAARDSRGCKARLPHPAGGEEEGGEGLGGLGFFPPLVSPSRERHGGWGRRSPRSDRKSVV